MNTAKPIIKNGEKNIMTEAQTTNLPALKFPPYAFFCSIAIALIIPYVARLPVVPIRGMAWLLDYFPGSPGIYFFSLFNSAPGIAWYALSRMGKKAPLAFWMSIGGGSGFLLWAHGSVNLTASSTAVIALLFIPFYATGVLLLSWLLGLFAHFMIKDERIRLWIAVTCCVSGIVLGTSLAVLKSYQIVSNESRFPALTIATLPLVKEQIYPETAFEKIEVIAYDEFDRTPGKEFAVLDAAGITTLSPVTYEIKERNRFMLEPCAGCIHMHPYIVPDGQGSWLISTSNGVSDSRGNLVWEWQTKTFSRIVPIPQPSSQPHFLTYQHENHVVLRHANGAQIWRDDLPATRVGVFNTPANEALPFAITRSADSNELTLYNLDGTKRRTVQLPSWASHVEQIAWPSDGYFLIGAGALLGVMDSTGKVILKHRITNTSFAPYHGPNGTAVKLSPTDRPYLAIMSHGSAGFPRSVLLIFNPQGQLVWQEEIKRIRSALASPRDDGVSEVLLVGGLDGILEYRLKKH